MNLSVQYWSYFRDLAGSALDRYELADGGTVADLLEVIYRRHPQLAPLRACARVAVGVEYALPEQVLVAGDEVSLFPPVQGG
jgi:molybdopterin converting factor small subunit